MLGKNKETKKLESIILQLEDLHLDDNVNFEAWDKIGKVLKILKSVYIYNENTFR